MWNLDVLSQMYYFTMATICYLGSYASTDTILLVIISLVEVCSTVFPIDILLTDLALFTNGITCSMNFVHLLVQDAAAGESYKTKPCYVFGKGCSVVELLLTTLCLRTAVDRGYVTVHMCCSF